jgi:hypothetical protein
MAFGPSGRMPADHEFPAISLDAMATSRFGQVAANLFLIRRTFALLLT